MIYGEGQPGAPGTWDREIYRALHAARVGKPNGRHRWKLDTPFHYSGILVTKAEPRLPWGRSTHGRGHLSHMIAAVLMAWQDGKLIGHMTAWHCGARTAYFRLIDEPDSPICPACRYRTSTQEGQ